MDERLPRRVRGGLGLAAAALALALALLVNRILREQYALLAERELLLAERAEQAEAARRFARVKSELADSLSEELRDGLTGVAHVLATATRGRSAPTRAQVSVAMDAVNQLLAMVVSYAGDPRQSRKSAAPRSGPAAGLTAVRRREWSSPE